MSDTAQDKESESSNSPGVKETPAGVKFEGEWSEVVGFLDEFTKELEQNYQESKWEDESVDNELTKRDRWRPQEAENEENLKLETAKQAKFEPKIPPKDNLKKSSTALKVSQKELEKGNSRMAVTFFLAGLSKFCEGLVNLIGERLGNLEEIIYRHITTRTNPYYFDTQLMSARLRKRNSLSKDLSQRYEITVKVHNRSIQKRISRRIK